MFISALFRLRLAIVFAQMLFAAAGALGQQSHRRPFPTEALEKYDQPPAPFGGTGVSPAMESIFGGFVSHQVNVNADGMNITGDAANDLTSLVMDPNVHIMETKALVCDIRPGRRPRGPAKAAFVEDYRRRAGITEHTGVAP